MKKLELVFIPVPGFGHLTSAIQFAKLLLDQEQRLSITIIVIIAPTDHTQIAAHTNSLAASNSRIRFTMISSTIRFSQSSSPTSIEKLASLFIESHKPQVEQAVMELLSDDSTQLLGFVLDMFCSCMIDVANKFKVPSYIFFTSNMAFLGFLLHLPIRRGQVGVLDFDLSDPDSVIPSFTNLVPANVLPGAVFDKEGGGYETYLYLGTRFGESKGIIVNSFRELEPYAVSSITAPLVYPVGPLLQLESQNKSTGSDNIKSWLDNQPPKSVLFLCFGSLGSFDKPQLEQIAIALERSGHRFLWSIRKRPLKDTHGGPSDYTNVEEALPDGFLARTKERGLVCGWAPQVEVLGHGSVKGFVSHCGWNSILESLWYGVPIATWPLSAEQQMNAFWLVREMGLAVELSLSYRTSESELVMADEIEKAINILMDDKNPTRERVKEISEKSRKALMEGGCSFVTLHKLIEDMFENIGEKMH